MAAEYGFRKIFTTDTFRVLKKPEIERQTSLRSSRLLKRMVTIFSSTALVKKMEIPCSLRNAAFTTTASRILQERKEGVKRFAREKEKEWVRDDRVGGLDLDVMLRELFTSAKPVLD